MSLRNSSTTSDFLEWNSAMLLTRKLYDDKQFVLSLLIGCGCFFGLRISDLLNLKWNNLFDQNSLVITEKKTKKQREIRITKQLQHHISDCYQAIKPKSLDEPIFKSKMNTVYSVQRVNKILKGLKSKYNLKIQNFSSHTLRKTFGRKIFELSCQDGKGELSLVKLSELFGHSSPAITRLYLGITREEKLKMYELLSF